MQMGWLRSYNIIESWSGEVIRVINIIIIELYCYLWCLCRRATFDQSRLHLSSLGRLRISMFPLIRSDLFYFVVFLVFFIEDSCFWSRVIFWWSSWRFVRRRWSKDRKGRLSISDEASVRRGRREGRGWSNIKVY